MIRAWKMLPVVSMDGVLWRSKAAPVPLRGVRSYVE